MLAPEPPFASAHLFAKVRAARGQEFLPAVRLEDRTRFPPDDVASDQTRPVEVAGKLLCEKDVARKLAEGLSQRAGRLGYVILAGDRAELVSGAVPDEADDAP